VAFEIERKFLVRGWEWKPAVPGKTIRQGYLCLDPDRSVRIRLVEERAFLTIKGASKGATRLEFEYPVPTDDARQLLSMCQLGLIEKTRYKIEDAGRTWDVDEFHGLNDGLILAEVELESEQCSVEIPPWVGKEVTDDPRYFNLQLVLNPYSLW
jgi:CYTH domain-containing protein